MTGKGMLAMLSVVLSWSRLLAADPNPPQHEPTVPAGSHPRLLLTAGAELDAARNKVATGTWSSALYQNAAASTSKINLDGPTTLPGIYDVLYASQPMLGLLDPLPAERDEWCRSAVNTSVKIIDTYDAPYPETYPPQTEWWGRSAYRFLALTYDACYGQIADKAKFQDEMKSIASTIAASRIEDSPGNHGTVFAVDLALIAIALDGDIDTDTHTITETMVRKTTYPQADFPRFRYPIQVLCVSATPPGPGIPCTYQSGTDYTVAWTDNGGYSTGHGIRWSATSSNVPAMQQSYYVQYVFKADVQLWRDRARLTLQRNLDHLWGDGASFAGIEYGSWTLAWMVDAFEAIRRSTGHDFGQHPTVQGAVSWYASELIPPGNSGIARVHNRNDSTYSALFRYQAPGTGTFLAWVMQRYKDDAQGRDDAAYWLLQRDTRWNWTARWREALWVNDAYSGPPSPLALPLSTFFGAQNLANFRSGSWDGPTADWALLTLAAHAWQPGEHSQTDEGAFSFYAAGEDFAIDTGYAWIPPPPTPIENIKNNSTEGHNLVLFPYSTYGNGNCAGGTSTVQESTGGASVRSSFLSGAFDTIHVDLKKTYLPSGALPLIGDPPCWPVPSAERYALLLKRAGRAPYAVIADSITVNAASRTYQFAMHTAAGKSVATNGSTATVGGTSGTLTAYATAASPVTWSSDTWPYSVANSEVPTHPRLLASANAVDPKLLVVLVPEKTGEANPLAVTVDDPAGGNRAVVTVTGSGLVDVILRNETNGLTVSGSGIETDAGLAVVRKSTAGAVLAWTVQNGTYLRHNNVDLWRVLAPSGKAGSAVWDGTSVSVIADDVTEFKAWAPGSAAFQSGAFTHLAVLEGSLVHWRGTRRLLDVEPEGVPAFQDDFSSTVSSRWASYPLWSRFSRVIGGEYCDQGRNGQGTSYVSHTNRSFDSYRADTLQSPRAIYGDATWGGSFTVQAAPALPPSAKVVLLARVADRSLSTVDQDGVRLEMDVVTGTGVLTGRVAGGVTTLWSGSLGAIGTGTEHTYAWTLDGSALSFKLDGVQRFSITAPPATIPSSGYFEWEVMPNLHVHFDDVAVDLPGRTLDACTTDAQCADGLYCTQDLCNPTTHACSHPPVTCPTSEPHCSVGACDEGNDQCVEEPILPPPPPWRCGRNWCMCAS